MRYSVNLPPKFSEVITHDGVPELGFIEHYTRNAVEWSFTAREIYAVLSDARNVQSAQKRLMNGKITNLYRKEVREAAHNAEIRLENLINAKNIPVPVP